MLQKWEKIPESVRLSGFTPKDNGFFSGRRNILNPIYLEIRE